MKTGTDEQLEVRNPPITLKLLRSKTFNRIVGSYLIVFLFPLLMTATLVQVTFIRDLYRNIVDSSINDLLFGARIIDNRIDQLYNIVNLAMIDREIDDFYDPYNKPVEVNDLKSRLNFLSLNAELPSETIIYQPDDFYLYSNLTSMSFDIFLKRFPIDGVASSEAFQAVLDQLDEPRIFSTNRNTNSEFLYAFPLRAFVRKPKILLFLINGISLSKELSIFLSMNTGCALVTTSQNDIVYYVNTDKSHDEAFYADVWQSFAATLQDENEEIQETLSYRGQKYIMNVVRSGDGHLKYINIIGQATIIRQQAKNIIVWAMILLASLIVGIFIVAKISKYSYQPIVRLKKKASDIYGKSAEKANDFDAISDSIDYLDRENTFMHHHISNISDYLVMQLLKGHIYNVDEFEQLQQTIKISLHKTGFQVAVLVFAKSEERERVSAKLQAHLLADISFSLRPIIPGLAYALVVSYTEVNSGQITGCMKLVLHDLMTLSSIGLGNPQQSIQSVSKSFIEAIAAANYMIAHRERGIQHYGSLDYDRSSSVIIEKLAQAIENNSESGVNQVMAIIEREFACREEKNEQLRILCLDLLLLLIKKSKEIDVQISVFDYPNMFLLLQESNNADLWEIIKKMHADITRCLLSPRVFDTKNTIKQMIIYIKEHYMDPGFSLKHMVIEFHMALPAISRLFKDSTGENIIEFITRLKIDKAKYLLATTSLSIKEISIGVGYYNDNSFIRRFKQVTTLTPGEYRKISGATTG